MKRLYMFLVLLTIFSPYVLDAQTLNKKAGTQDPIGITVIVKGAVQPIIDHTPPGQGRQSVPVSFAVEADALYRIPIDLIELDVGIGLRYLIERAVDSGQNGYSLIPLYAVVQLPFGIPSFEEVWKIYLDGRIGYAFFLPNSQYRAQYLTDANPVGGLFAAIGLGTVYLVNDLFQVRLAVSYNIHNSIDAAPRGRITENIFEVSAGVGFSF